MENTLYKIQDLIRQNAGGDVNATDSITNFDVMAIEARNCWASMLFSNTSDLAINRYASYQLRELNKCLVSFSNILETDLNSSDNKPTTSTGIKKKLFLLSDAFFEDFGDYLTETPVCPASYHFYVCTSTNSDRNIVQEWLNKIVVNKHISEIIKTYLVSINDFRNIHYRYADIAYYQRFIQELKYWSLLNIEGDLTLKLIEKLIELNFNHLDLFAFQQQQLRTKYIGSDLKTAISVIRQELSKIPYREKRNKLRLDYRWLATSDMLCNWLTGELNSLEAQLQSDSKPLQHIQKLPFQLSVAHLACLIRLFAKEHIFGEISLTEIFEFFGKNCSSKRQRIISAGGISKEFYSMSQVVAAEMRDILQRMINRINRDYFPVMAAILLTIGFC